MNANLELFMERYLRYLRVLNHSSVTIKRYQGFLGHFSGFLKELKISDVQEIRKEHILSYQREVFYQINRKGRQNLPQTQNNYLKTLKSFFAFLKSEDYLGYDPAADVAYARTPQTLPRTILTQKEMKKLLRSPDISTPLGYRDRAILEVLYSTAIRRAELLNLKPEDIDYERGLLRVNRGKGEKDRIVPLGRLAAKYLENYVKLVWLDLNRKKESPELFLSLRGKRLSEPALKALINKYTKRAKINKSVSPHVFRHSCATHLIQEKANIRCVQEILGHKSLDTTQKYTRITITDLKEAHQRCHPREKERSP